MANTKEYTRESYNTITETFSQLGTVVRSLDKELNQLEHEDTELNTGACVLIECILEKIDAIELVLQNFKPRGKNDIYSLPIDDLDNLVTLYTENIKTLLYLLMKTFATLTDVASTKDLLKLSYCLSANLYKAYDNTLDGSL